MNRDCRRKCNHATGYFFSGMTKTISSRPRISAIREPLSERATRPSLSPSPSTCPQRYSKTLLPSEERKTVIRFLSVVSLNWPKEGRVAFMHHETSAFAIHGDIRISQLRHFIKSLATFVHHNILGSTCMKKNAIVTHKPRVSCIAISPKKQNLLFSGFL